MGREVTGRDRGAPGVEAKGFTVPGFCPTATVLLELLLLLLLAGVEIANFVLLLFPSCCFKA